MAIVNGARSVSLFDKLEQMSAQFHLTGSRYFSGHGNDFDYFTEHSTEVMRELLQIGFTHIGLSRYGDSNCIAVMRGIDFNGIQIDIQLVKDVDLKLRVQETLKELGYGRPTREEWNLAFKVMRLKTTI